jgi:protocatechuate 3,4-dioxygenase beta subunit
MPRGVVLSAIMLAFTLNAGAQVRDPRVLPDVKGTAVIKGRVVAADGNRPLRRVQIRAAGVGRDRTTSTDEDGQYELVDLPAGRYTLSAVRAGFLTLVYGQRRPREIGRVVDVADVQIVDHIDFALPRMAVIAGRITDEEGEPIAGVNVYAMRSAYFNGRRQLLRTTAANITTDDAGEYRLSGLVPGTYSVIARSRDEWMVDENGRQQTMGYVPTYYPGVINVNDAGKVTVGVGEEGRADFSLQPGRAATVSGIAIDSHGKPFPMVNLALEVRSEGGGFFGSAGNTRTGPDGGFTFRDVAPGDYILRANRQDPDPEIAMLPISIEGADVTNLTLTGTGGGTVSGRVALEDGVSSPMPAVTVGISERWLGQPDPSMLGIFRNRFVPATASQDGTFSVDHVIGPAYFNVTLPDGWIVRSVVSAGRDLTDAPVEMRSGENLTGVIITITNRITRLSGTLSAGSASAVDGTVIVFPVDAQKRFDYSRFIKAARPDQKGRYEIKGLPPGDYLAVALEYVEDGAWHEPAYLQSLQDRARPVTLTLSEPQTLPLTLVAQP